MRQQLQERDRLMVGVTALEPYSLRPASVSDIPAAMALANERDKALIGVGTQAHFRYRAAWTSPHGNLETDSLVVEDDAGNMVAWAHVGVRPPFVMGWVMAAVHPDLWGRGIGAGLMSWAEPQARRLTEQAPDDAMTCMVSGVLAEDERAAKLLGRCNMAVKRHFVYMVTDLDSDLPAPAWPDGIEIRPVDPEAHDRAICLAHVEAFRDHWGHIDRTDEQEYEMWRHWTKSDDELDYNLWFVAWDGDEIAAMSICWPKGEGDPETGYVGILCTRRAWRGRGLGLALLQHSFRHFSDAGRKRCSLHADAENLTGALKLYRKAGMGIERRYDHYEKELRAGRDLRVITLED